MVSNDWIQEQGEERKNNYTRCITKKVIGIQGQGSEATGNYCMASSSDFQELRLAFSTYCRSNAGILEKHLGNEWLKMTEVMKLRSNQKIASRLVIFDRASYEKPYRLANSSSILEIFENLMSIVHIYIRPATASSKTVV